MISVIIPVYEGARFIAAALHSVIAQSSLPLEVFVVNDGSIDQSARIARGFGPPIRVIERTHQGGAAALNAGIAEAKGELLAFLDADDLWAPEKLALQRTALACNPHLDAVFGRVVQFTDIECQIFSPSELSHLTESVPGMCKTAMMIRRTSFDRTGPFDPDRVAEFPEWYARARLSGLSTKMLDQVVAYRRIHGKNTTRSQREVLKQDYFKIIRRSLSTRAS